MKLMQRLKGRAVPKLDPNLKLKEEKSKQILGNSMICIMYVNNLVIIVELPFFTPTSLPFFDVVAIDVM